MRASWCIGVVLLVLLVLVLGPAAADRGEGKKGGLFAPLEKGQQVSLREKAGGWDIAVVPGVALGYKVIEVGTDYVVLEDITELTQRRIPIYAIRSVTVSQLPR